MKRVDRVVSKEDGEEARVEKVNNKEATARVIKIELIFSWIEVKGMLGN